MSYLSVAFRVRGTVLAALLLFCSPSLAQEKQEWTPEQQAIVDLLKNGPMNIETNFENWEDKYHEEWTVWFAGQPTVRQKPAHMERVRDYIGQGAKVISYTAQFADISVIGNTAFARFNAIEELRNPDGSPRTVYYAGTDYLIKVDGQWKVRATTVAFTPQDEESGE